MRSFLLILLFFITYTFSFAQNDRQAIYWTRYFNRTTLNKWQLDLEIDNRRFIEPHVQEQFIIRTTVLYNFNKHIKAGQGFAYSISHDAKSGIFIPELRPHQELEIVHSFGRFDFGHRIRFEQRFTRQVENQELLKTYDNSLRARYRFQINYDVIKKENRRIFALRFRSEPFLSYDDRKFNLSQYRFYGGFIYRPIDAIALELGYMWLERLQQAKSVEQWDVIRFTMRHYIKIK